MEVFLFIFTTNGNNLVNYITMYIKSFGKSIFTHKFKSKRFEYDLFDVNDLATFRGVKKFSFWYSYAKNCNVGEIKLMLDLNIYWVKLVILFYK